MQLSHPHPSAAVPPTSLSSPPEETVRLGLEIDYHGEVYLAGEKVLRAIRPEYEPFYGGLLERPLIKELMEEGGLIYATRSDVQIPGRNLVLEHPRVPFVTYPFEWSATMLKKAAQLLLKLNIRLMEDGLCLEDAHLWNVLFDGTTPRFVDFTSIAPLPESGRWEASSSFNSYCANALVLMSKGQHALARPLLRDMLSPPKERLCDTVLPNPRKHGDHTSFKRDVRIVADLVSFFVSIGLNRLSRRLNGYSDSASLEQVMALLQQIGKLDVTPPREEWSDYYECHHDVPMYDDKTALDEQIKPITPKHALVCELLERLRPATLLDLGCNRGLYSQFAARAGAKVIGMDTDERAIDRMFLDSEALGSQVIPLCANAVSPAEAIGFKERPFPSVTERLRVECVLCLALTHHLVFRVHMTFPHIVEALCSYATKNLIVEFVPLDDAQLSSSLRDRPQSLLDRCSWYTKDNFVAALRDHFGRVTEFKSFPDPRTLFLCEERVASA